MAICITGFVLLCEEASGAEPEEPLERLPSFLGYNNQYFAFQKIETDAEKLAKEQAFIEEQGWNKPEEPEYKTSVHKVIKQTPSKLGYNCVAYAKSKRPDIGQGFSTLGQKKNKIRTKQPKEGLVGVTPEGPIGHLIYVEKVKETTLIISDGNYHRGFITIREIPKSLVLGYL
jgi:surface antigen